MKKFKDSEIEVELMRINDQAKENHEVVSDSHVQQDPSDQPILELKYHKAHL